MNGVQRRNASAWLLPNDGSRTNHQLRRDMRRYGNDDEVDIVIIGCGAGGSVLAQRLARHGWDVVVLDAGPFWDPDKDWVSDEAGSHQLYWNEPRVISGADPVELGSNNSGRGVGGSMVHFAGYAPRFHPSDFRTLTSDGVGADWPIDYGHLKKYYGLLEAELPVAGQSWPWGDPHRYPHSPHPMGANGLAFQRAALAAGIDVRIGPVAISNGRFGNRSHCIYRGFCLQGCKVNAKASPLITHIPDALAHGAEIRPDCMVSRIEVDDQPPRDRDCLLPRRTRISTAGPARSRRGILHRDPTPSAQLGLSAVPRRPVQRLRPGRPVRHGAGRPPDHGPLRRRDQVLQSSASRMFL